jgi:hypothetical protein
MLRGTDGLYAVPPFARLQLLTLAWFSHGRSQEG